MEKKVLKLSINDKVYSISSDQNEEQLTEAAKMVDTLFREIASKTQFANEGKVAVLTALQLAFDLTKKSSSDKVWASKLEAMVNLLDKELTA